MVALLEKILYYMERNGLPMRSTAHRHWARIYLYNSYSTVASFICFGHDLLYACQLRFGIAENLVDFLLREGILGQGIQRLCRRLDRRVHQIA